MKGNCPYGKSCKYPHLAFDMQPPEGPPPGMLRRDVLVANPKALPPGKQTHKVQTVVTAAAPAAAVRGPA